MTRKAASHLLVIALLEGFICEAFAGMEPVCEREMRLAADRTGVPLGVLYAVALTETGQRGALNAYAMNIEGASVFNENLTQALATFASARGRGAKLIDVGCMQINHHYHGRHFSSVEAMFDPAHNVDYAARFLKSLNESEGSWTSAIARYHASPSNRPAQKTYVCAVIGNMIKSGFGGWTTASRQFCEGVTR